VQDIVVPTAADQDLDLPFHPDANVFDLMKGAEFDELVADVKQHGLREPIVTFEEKVIDGRNRARACAKAGVKPHYRPFQGEAKDVVAFIISANIHRRHLTPEDKRDLLGKLIKLHPEKTVREIAKIAKVGKSTVARCVPPGTRPDTRVDSKGRKQPTKKPRKVDGSKPTGNLSAVPKPPALDLGRGEYAEISTAVPISVTPAISPSAPPTAPSGKHEPDTAVLFMMRVNQLLPLVIHGLRLTAADAARVADLRTKLQQVIIENSDASAPGAVVHSVDTTESGINA
jgi:hypothetical protein